MRERTAWQTVRSRGNQIVEEVRTLIHEGNVRRVVVRQQGRTVAEFPLTVGVVGALAAPVLAAVGALVALLADCRIDVERAVEARSASRARSRKPRPTGTRRATTRRSTRS